MQQIPARFRYGGNWGSAYDAQGNLLAEMVQVDAPVEIGRVPVPLVGSQDVGYKTGGRTREGTMMVQKIDATWELKVFSQLSLDPDELRALRDSGTFFDPTFSLVVKIDDPEAAGKERWQLDGVRIWRLPLGINIADELVQREYPITWERERPLTAFKLKQQGSTFRAEYAYGSA